SLPVDVATDSPPPVEITIDQGATAILHVKDEEGRPVEGAFAGLMIRTFSDNWSSSMRYDHALTPADGRLVFDEMPTDGMPIAMILKEITNDFFASKDGYGKAKEQRRVKFAPGERKEITIILPPLEERGTIAGIVK